MMRTPYLLLLLFAGACTGNNAEKTVQRTNKDSLTMRFQHTVDSVKLSEIRTIINNPADSAQIKRQWIEMQRQIAAANANGTTAKGIAALQRKMDSMRKAASASGQKIDEMRPDTPKN